MNILVTGANGQLGTSIRKASRDPRNNYIFTDVAELDIPDARAVREAVDFYDIDLIINCAAYTNVDKAEDDADFARVLNADAPRNLAEALAPRGGMLIHISTDYVFGGNSGNTPRAEDEPANPTGVYGSTVRAVYRPVRSKSHHNTHRLALQRIWQQFPQDYAPADSRTTGT